MPWSSEIYLCSPRQTQLLSLSSGSFAGSPCAVYHKLSQGTKLLTRESLSFCSVGGHSPSYLMYNISTIVSNICSFLFYFSQKVNLNLVTSSWMGVDVSDWVLRGLYLFLYILSYRWLENILSQIVLCLLIILTLALVKEKFVFVIFNLVLNLRNFSWLWMKCLSPLHFLYVRLFFVSFCLGCEHGDIIFFVIELWDTYFKLDICSELYSLGISPHL